MGTELKAEGSEQIEGGNPAIGIVGKVEERFRELKKHAETYPYVWGSYAVVYGGFGLWFAYRWRRLRKTEDRVRVLQERLRQLAAQTEESGTTSSSASTKVDKPVTESAGASSSAPTKVDKPVTESASTSSSAPSKVDKLVKESASTSSTASTKADTPPQ